MIKDKATDAHPYHEDEQSGTRSIHFSAIGTGISSGTITKFSFLVNFNRNTVFALFQTFFVLIGEFQIHFVFATAFAPNFRSLSFPPQPLFAFFDNDRPNDFFTRSFAVFTQNVLLGSQL